MHSASERGWSESRGIVPTCFSVALLRQFSVFTRENKQHSSKVTARLVPCQWGLLSSVKSFGNASIRWMECSPVVADQHTQRTTQYSPHCWSSVGNSMLYISIVSDTSMTGEWHEVSFSFKRLQILFSRSSLVVKRWILYCWSYIGFSFNVQGCCTWLISVFLF
jgi:hypothetical protein